MLIMRLLTLQPLGQFFSEKDIGKLALIVRRPRIVFLFRVQVLEIDSASCVGQAGDIYDSAGSGLLEGWEEEVSEKEMTHVVHLHKYACKIINV